MKKTLLISITISALFFTGCISQKKIAYFKNIDATSAEEINQEFQKQREPIIGAGDILLITVTGVGPKSAQCILSTLTADDLRFAIISGDFACIAKTPGVGKKGAERIILELTDKISVEDAFSQKSYKGNLNESAASSNKNEVIEALVSLGYSPAETLRAMNQIDDGDSLTTEELLKATLKKIMWYYDIYFINETNLLNLSFSLSVSTTQKSLNFVSK